MELDEEDTLPQTAPPEDDDDSEMPAIPDSIDTPSPPGLGVLILVVPLLCLVFGLQIVELKERVGSQETQIRNESTVEQIDQIKQDYARQSDEWDLLVKSHQASLSDTQANLARIEAELATLNEQKAGAVSHAAQAVEQLRALKTELAEGETGLQTVKSETEVLSTLKSDLETAHGALKAEYASLQATRDVMREERDTAQAELATAKEKAKQQAIALQELQRLTEEAATKRSALAGLKEEFTAKERIAQALTEEVKRLKAQRAEFDSTDEIARLEVQRDSLEKERRRLSAAVAGADEQLKQRLLTIEQNEEVIETLTVKKAQLTNISEEISTQNRISAALKKEVARLNARQAELSLDVDRLQTLKTALKEKKSEEPSGDEEAEE